MITRKRVGGKCGRNRIQKLKNKTNAKQRKTKAKSCVKNK
jgi:hypothetical protein